MRDELIAMIFLSLGSNKGEVVENLRMARDLLQKVGVRIVAQSPEVTTKAWGITDQPDFLNQVLLVEWDSGEGAAAKPPHLLLDLCQKVEELMGKTMPTDSDYVKWGPRTIDIDILSYNELVLHDERLTLPHHTLEKDYIQELVTSIITNR